MGVAWRVEMRLERVAEMAEASRGASGMATPDTASEAKRGARGRIRLGGDAVVSSGETTYPASETGSERTRSGRVVSMSSSMMGTGQAPVEGGRPVDARVVKMTSVSMSAVVVDTVLRGMRDEGESANTAVVVPAKDVGGEEDEDAVFVRACATENAADMGPGQEVGEEQEREAW